MTRMINAITGGEMLVDESRVEEYVKRGHKLAADKKGNAADKSVSASTEKKATANKAAKK